MRTLAQDSKNDIYLDPTGNLVLAYGLEAYGNIIADTCRTVLNELQLDIDAGIDYFGTVFTNVNGIPEWKSEVRKIIMSYDFVESIDEIEASFNSETKILSYSVTINTDLGTTTITQ